MRVISKGAAPDPVGIDFSRPQALHLILLPSIAMPQGEVFELRSFMAMLNSDDASSGVGEFGFTRTSPPPPSSDHSRRAPRRFSMLAGGMP
jgi:hypothetical protein